MTKKDYERIARVIASYKRVAASGVDGQMLVRCMALDMAETLKQDNTRFNMNVFLAACGQPPATT